MYLSNFGKIVKDELLKSFHIRKELFQHEYVIMPNHLHAIVEIKKPHRKYCKKSKTFKAETDEDNMIQDVSPKSVRNLSIKRNMPVRLPKSISSFVAGFKSSVNSKIDDFIDKHHLKIPKYNRHNHFFQPNYHDHVIRDKLEYQRIKYYIRYNPKNWEYDKFNVYQKELCINIEKQNDLIYL